MKDPVRYIKADKLLPGISVCNAGYMNCPHGNQYHWHCSNCGGISGHQGHYWNIDGKGWRFTCEDDEK